MKVEDLLKRCLAFNILMDLCFPKNLDADEVLGTGMPKPLRHKRLMPNEKCAYENCDRDAVLVAVGKNDEHKKPASYCEEHGYNVADESGPEYIQSCPNCGCTFGVN